MINPVSIENAMPTGIDGADVYITDSNNKLLFFIGSLQGSALWKLHEIAQKLSLKCIDLPWIRKIDYSCKISVGFNQANSLKKEIEILNDYQKWLHLDESCLHNLAVLETAVNMVLKEKDKHMYIIGD